VTQPVAVVLMKRRNLFEEAPDVCAADDLGRDDARALARRLAIGMPFARLVEARRGAVGDLIVLDVALETPQRTVHDIRFEERIAVLFPAHTDDADDMDPPEAFAMRNDFPSDVPHLNLRSYEYPKSLCLYDVPFTEIRSTWTPAQYVTLLREWLRLTAIGALHAPDQPLEPLMMGGAGWLILPNLLRTHDAAFGLTRRGELGKLPVLVAVPPKSSESSDLRHLVALVRAKPRTHGIIRRAPATLADLHELLLPEDDVFAQISCTIRQWRADFQ
jgi:hypothetical protein